MRKLSHLLWRETPVSQEKPAPPPPRRSPRQPTFGEQVQDLSERFGAWLDELLPGPQPIPVPVPVPVRRRR
jgi:hypothetical protein